MKYDSVIIGLAADGPHPTFENKEDPNNQEQSPPVKTLTTGL